MAAARCSRSTRAKPRPWPALSRANRIEPISPNGEKMACKSLVVVLGDRFPTSSVVTVIPPLRGALPSGVTSSHSDALPCGVNAGDYLVAVASRRTLREAIAAVNGPVAPRLERDLSGLATLSADSRVHVSGGTAVASAIASAVATAAALRLAGSATAGAPLWLIGEAAAGVKLLVIR